MASSHWFLQEKAALMRENPTAAELLAAKAIGNELNYESQVVFGNYILDFVIPDKLLVLQVDGYSHNKCQEEDAVRDAFCNSRGLQVLRIKNRLAHTALIEILKFELVENGAAKWQVIFDQIRGKKHKPAKTPQQLAKTEIIRERKRLSRIRRDTDAFARSAIN